MQAGDFKALFGALVLPPAGLILLALLGLLLARPSRRFGGFLMAVALVSLWLLASPQPARYLSRALLPLPPAVTLVDLRRARTQAVVVLGGGVLPEAPEYGAPQPAATTLGRLRYGVRLSRTSALPLGFAGGLGWAGNGSASEGQAAQLSARQDFGHELRWVDDQSRDTRENAWRMAALLHRDGIRRIALVSDAWHLPRAAQDFRRAGFEVLPAPTHLPAATEKPWLEWMPTIRGLELSRSAIREWLALRAAG